MTFIRFKLLQRKMCFFLWMVPTNFSTSVHTVNIKHRKEDLYNMWECTILREEGTLNRQSNRKKSRG